MCRAVLPSNLPGSQPSVVIPHSWLPVVFLIHKSNPGPGQVLIQTRKISLSHHNFLLSCCQGILGRVRRHPSLETFRRTLTRYHLHFNRQPVQPRLAESVRCWWPSYNLADRDRHNQSKFSFISACTPPNPETFPSVVLAD